METFFPGGAHNLESENFVKKTIVGLLPLEIKCIGPVSFPTEMIACLDNFAILKNLFYYINFPKLKIFLLMFDKSADHQLTQLELVLFFLLVKIQ